MRLANALVSYVTYIVKTIWPADLAALYPFLPVPLWKWVGAAAAMAGICAAVYRYGRRRPYLPLGWLWYLGTLVPVIGLVQVGGQAMADRFTYIPHIGLFVMVAWGAAEIAARLRMSKTAVTIAAGLAILAYTLGVMQEGSTGLYYMRARYYDSATARFLSHDPIPSADPREVNPYQYALADPVNRPDPPGLSSQNNIGQRLAAGRITSSNGLQIARDDAGRIAAITYASGKTVRYTYDNRACWREWRTGWGGQRSSPGTTPGSSFRRRSRMAWRNSSATTATGG